MDRDRKGGVIGVIITIIILILLIIFTNQDVKKETIINSIANTIVMPKWINIFKK